MIFEGTTDLIVSSSFVLRPHIDCKACASQRNLQHLWQNLGGHMSRSSLQTPKAVKIISILSTQRKLFSYLLSSTIAVHKFGKFFAIIVNVQRDQRQASNCIIEPSAKLNLDVSNARLNIDSRNVSKFLFATFLLQKGTPFGFLPCFRKGCLSLSIASSGEREYLQFCFIASSAFHLKRKGILAVNHVNYAKKNDLSTRSKKKQLHIIERFIVPDCDQNFHQKKCLVRAFTISVASHDRSMMYSLWEGDHTHVVRLSCT